MSNITVTPDGVLILMNPKQITWTLRALETDRYDGMFEDADEEDQRHLDELFESLIEASTTKGGALVANGIVPGVYGE